MLETKVTSKSGGGKGDSCDVRIWSKNCEHKDFKDISDKYRCDVCEAIPVLNHEVHRAAMPYVSGDYERLS